MIEQIKVIFLDIDGVLNCHDWYSKRWKMYQEQDDIIERDYPMNEVDTELIQRLNRITTTTGAKIVISSTWRMGRTLDELKTLFGNWGISGELIDKTISMGSSAVGYSIPRGCEIEHWLKGKHFQRINWSVEKQKEYAEKSEVSTYVILDDDSDMLLCQTEHYIKTSQKCGLTEEMVDRAINILNTDICDLYYKEDASTYEEIIYKES